MTGSRAIKRLALGTMAGALALFHGQLLWQRWVDGTLFDLEVVTRWAASALLITAFAWAYRRHGTLLRSREAAVLWTLVLLLHALAGIPATTLVAAPVPWLVLPLGVLAFEWFARSRADRSARLGPGTASRLRHSEPLAALRPGHAGVPGCRAPPL